MLSATQMAKNVSISASYCATHKRVVSPSFAYMVHYQFAEGIERSSSGVGEIATNSAAVVWF